jgi:hypothetical protein
MTALDAFRDGLRAQDAIILAQRDPASPVDVLGRPVTPCCGALDLGDGDHGGRPFHCCHQYEIWRDEAAVRDVTDYDGEHVGVSGEAHRLSNGPEPVAYSNRSGPLLSRE